MSILFTRVKKIYKLSLMLAICSISTNLLAMEVNMQYMEKPLDIPAILQLQKNMVMSKKPAELSAQPSVTCFAVNINAFLLNPSSQDKKTYGCIFSDQVAMNAALLRAGLYVHTDIGMASDAQLFNSKLMQAVGGHDFLGKELVKYQRNAKIDPQSAAGHQELKDIEQQF